MLGLNKQAWNMLQDIVEKSADIGVDVLYSENGAVIVDAGVSAEGSIKAGLLVSQLLLAGMADVKLLFWNDFLSVQVSMDNPVIPCFASQYAGWRISIGNFYGMGSGPARLLLDSEPIILSFGWKDDREKAVLFLESDDLPSQDVIDYIVRSCSVREENLGLIVAPSRSMVGFVQIASRVVETAMHKLNELGYDLYRVKFATGVSPLSPGGKNSLDAIGRANDAIIYGGKVVIFVDDDEDLSELANKVSSTTSADYGKPFVEIFRASGGDFYKIDPMLFSPAEVSIVSVSNGNVFHAGSIRKDILKRSLGI